MNTQEFSSGAWPPRDAEAALRQQHLDIGLFTKNPPGGGCDLALGHYARGDLVQQRLEQVVLGSGDHCDIDRRILERLGRQ